MAHLGRPVSFKNGNITLVTQDTTPATFQLAIKSGSLTDEVNEIEAPTNCSGTLVSSGAAKVSLSASCYISASGLANGTASANFTAGMKPGQYVTANIVNGCQSYGGEFMITKFESSLDPNDNHNLDLSLVSNGDVSVRTNAVVTKV
jgi:hypothetical protein